MCLLKTAIGVMSLALGLALFTTMLYFLGECNAAAGGRDAEGGAHQGRAVADHRGDGEEGMATALAHLPAGA